MMHADGSLLAAMARRALGLTLLVGPTACGDELGSEKAAAAASAALGSAPELTVFPADYDVVMGLDLAQWEQTAAASVLAAHFAKADPAGFVALERDCRAMTASGSVSVGVRLAGDEPNDVLLRIEGARREVVLPCIERVAQMGGGPPTVTTEGSLDTIETGPDSKAYVMWTGETTALLGETAEFLRERSEASRGLDGNRRIVSRWHEVDRGAVFWGVVALSDVAVDELGVDVEAGHWSLARTDGLLLKAALTFGDGDAGRRTQAMFEAKAGKDDTPGLSVTVSDRTLELRYAADRAQVAELVEEFDDVLDWDELTAVMNTKSPRGGRSTPTPGGPSGVLPGVPIELLSFAPRFEVARSDEFSMPIAVEIRVLADMPHVAPDLGVIATCDGSTDDKTMFFMALNGAKKDALLREDAKLFKVHSLESLPRECEFRLQLQETAMAPLYYCTRAGATTLGRCSD